MPKAAPSGKDLEAALFGLLRRNHFSGAEDLRVLVVGPEATPVYLLTLSADVAKALGDLLHPVLGGRADGSLTEWVLFPPHAEAILEAGR